jgi:hypothetical protein
MKQSLDYIVCVFLVGVCIIFEASPKYIISITFFLLLENLYKIQDKLGIK